MIVDSCDAAPRRAGLAWALALNYAAMMMLAIAVNLVPVYLTTLDAAMGGLTKEQLGRIGAVTFAGLVAGILLTGPLADRFGPKRFAMLGNLLITAGLGVLALVQSYGAVLAAVALMGFGSGMLDMVLSPIVCALQPDRRTTAMNWLHSFYCVGAVATVLTASLALKAGISYRTLALWLTVLPALVALGFLGLRLPPLVAEGQARMRLSVLLRQPYFLMAVAAIFLAGGTELGLAQWLPAYTETSLGYSRWTGGMALLAFSVAMVVGRMLVGLIGPRVRPIPLLLGCCAASVILFLLASFAPWPSAALGAAVAVGLTGSTLWPSMLGVTADRFPNGGASMFGILAALGNAGGIIMPWVVGLTADAASLPWGIATGGLCPLLMAGCLLWMRGQGTGRD